MSNEDYSRFIFIGFEDLKKIKFDKLEQVCDKVFVFINKDEKAIPFSLVQRLQKLGDSVQWVPVIGETDEATCQFLNFHLGLMHEQLEEDIEFAVVSEDASFDNIIGHLNELGRNAVRVTGNKEQSEHTSDLNNMDWSKKEEEPAEAVEVIPQQDKTNRERLVEKPKPSAVSPQSQQLEKPLSD